MKKINLLSAILGFSMIVSFNSFASGIPVVDGAQIANQIKTWTVEADRWVKTLEQYKKEYQAQLDQIAAQTGVRDVLGFMKEAEAAYKKVKDLQSLVNDPSKIYRMGEGALSGELKNLYNKYGMFDLCKDYVGATKRQCEGEIINIAQKELNNDQNLEMLNFRMEKIKEIGDRMANAKDIKEAQDLNNALNTQSAMLNAQFMQMQITRDIEQQQKELQDKEKRKVLINKLDKDASLGEWRIN